MCGQAGVWFDYESTYFFKSFVSFSNSFIAFYFFLCYYCIRDTYCEDQRKQKKKVRFKALSKAIKYPAIHNLTPAVSSGSAAAELGYVYCKLNRYPTTVGCACESTVYTVFFLFSENVPNVPEYSLYWGCFSGENNRKIEQMKQE